MEAALSEELRAARRRFDEVCGALRPDLHRFCARMTGSPCDGEDVLQESLVLAFYRLPELREGASLRSWIFRIAHNKCIDFLRGRRRFEALDDEAKGEEPAMDEALEHKERAERAMARIAADLPPKERACIVLKDVLECSLEETAEITESNIGAVKAALNRARAKLEAAEGRERTHSLPLEPSKRALVERYLTAFNQRDWTQVRAFLADEARLEVVHRTEGPFGDTYFTNYSRLAWNWKLGLAWVDGVESVVHYRERDGVWAPHSAVQIRTEGDRITVVRDYVHVDYLLSGSEVVATLE